MDNLDKHLRNMSKIRPPRRFIKASKARLMHQIEFQNKESWFVAYLKKLGIIHVPRQFISQARVRLMNRITAFPQPVKVPLRQLVYSLNFLKRAVASTLIMLIAVTSTLFVVEGNTVVEASDDSYIEVLVGTASIKHADQLVWEDINNVIEVQAGDLIKVEEGSQAVVYFFDDTELRVNENSLFLISQLAVSPNFSRQGIIEISLHEGEAWVQTLNVEDGYARFVLSTRDAIVRTLNATFNVVTKLDEPTEISTFTNRVGLSTLNPETRQVVQDLKLGSNELARIYSNNRTVPLITISDLSEQDFSTTWIQSNIEQDAAHLIKLRETGFDRLTMAAGTLPGQMLYPIKQAKERLKLVFGSDTDQTVKIEIANNRLNEAIVLLETGETRKGREALMAYQAIARDILETGVPENIANKLIVPHQKVLTAELPNDAAAGLVKDTLQLTVEILAETPIDLELVRLQNSITRLQDIMALIDAGDLIVAKDRLVSHSLSESNILSAIEELDYEAKREVLKLVVELRQEESELLTAVSKAVSELDNQDIELIAMVETATLASYDAVEETLIVAAEFTPELTPKPVLSSEELKTAEIVGKIMIYNTFRGQRNQVERLLAYELEDSDSVEFLIAIRDQLDGRIYDYINVKILQIQRNDAYEKSKAIQRKIDRAKNFRENEPV